MGETLKNGKKMDKEYVTKHVIAGVGAGAVIKKDGKYLLVQEKKKYVYGLWNLPAGKVDKGNTFEETAVKEAKEETGYDIEVIRKIGIFQKSAEEAVKHAFEARIIGGELKVPKDELLDVQWFALKEIKAMQDKLRNPWVLEAIILVEDGLLNHK